MHCTCIFYVCVCVFDCTTPLYPLFVFQVINDTPMNMRTMGILDQVACSGDELFLWHCMSEFTDHARGQYLQCTSIASVTCGGETQMMKKKKNVSWSPLSFSYLQNVQPSPFLRKRKKTFLTKTRNVNRISMSEFTDH